MPWMGTRPTYHIHTEGDREQVCGRSRQGEMGILDVRFLTAEDERHLREFVQAQWPLHRTQLQPAIDAGLQKGSQHGLTWDMVDCKSRMLNISRMENDEAVRIGRTR